MMEFDLKVLGYGISCVVDINSNALKVKVNESLSGHVEFACYLYDSFGVVEKFGYNPEGFFLFNINYSSKYSLKFYVKDLNTKLRTSRLIGLGCIYIDSIYYKSHLFTKLNKTSFKLGKKYIDDRIISFPRFNDYKHNDEISIFEVDPFNNRTWVWKVQQLAFIPYFLSYYEFSGDAKVLILLNKLIVDWVSYSESYSSFENSMLWHDHGTSLRLNNLVLCFCYLNSENISSASFNDLLIEQIYLHILKLKDEGFYSSRTNHGFDQSLYLYQACLEFQKIIDVSQVIEVAENRIFNEIDFAFSSDGGHKENSVSYLNFGIKQCMMAYNIATSYGRENENVKFIENIINKAAKVLYFAMKPNGFLPYIGDTTEFKVVDIFSKNKIPEYPFFKYALTKGVVGKKPLSNKLILEKSGYAFYKSSWDKSNIDQALYLSFKAGYLSNYHRHDDDLSITLFAYGEDWLVDGGIYKYDERNVNRKYIRSSSSHNLLEPDNVKALRDSNNKHKVYVKELITNGFSRLNVLGYSEMFPGYVNTRNIVISEDNVIDVLDSCLGKGDINVTSRLFFYKDKEISIIGNRIHVYGGSKILMVEVLSDHLISIKKKDGKGNGVEGWLSNSINELYQANLVEIKCCSFEKISIKMRMNFIDLV